MNHLHDGVGHLLQASAWLIDGSGAESHFKILSSNATLRILEVSRRTVRTLLAIARLVFLHQIRRITKAFHQCRAKRHSGH